MKKAPIIGLFIYDNEMIMKNLLLSACFSLLLATPSLSFAQNASEESVRQFLIASGAIEAGMQPINEMLKDYRKMKLSKAKMAALENEFSADKLIEVLSPTYQKHFTEQEMQEFIQFYQSPAGRKLKGKQDVIMHDAKIAGEEWAHEIVLRLEKILL